MPKGRGLDSSIVLHWKADACQYWLIFSVVMIGAGGYYWHLEGRGQEYPILYTLHCRKESPSRTSGQVGDIRRGETEQPRGS